MAGVPLLVVGRNLGHADTRMVELHYGHLAPSYVTEAITRVRRATTSRPQIDHPAAAVNLAVEAKLRIDLQMAAAWPSENSKSVTTQCGNLTAPPRLGNLHPISPSWGSDVDLWISSLDPVTAKYSLSIERL